MRLMSKLNSLCTPAYVYFVVSIVAIVLSAIQNIGNKNRYSLGMFSCYVPSCIGVFVLKCIYIVFWTWILNLMCRDGHSGIAWLLVLFPFVLLFFVMTILMMYERRQREGMCSSCKQE